MAAQHLNDVPHLTARLLDYRLEVGEHLPVLPHDIAGRYYLSRNVNGCLSGKEEYTTNIREDAVTEAGRTGE